MNAIDFSPLFRSTIGFDRLQHLFDTAARRDEQTYAYPPYNIEVTSEDSYRISMAVAGFAEDDLDITTKENGLIVATKNPQDDATRTYLHRGIAGRSFERRFALADHIKVTSAQLANGLLHIDLVREVPEEKKSRNVEISTQPSLAPGAIEQKAA